MGNDGELLRSRLEITETGTRQGSDRDVGEKKGVEEQIVAFCCLLGSGGLLGLRHPLSNVFPEGGLFAVTPGVC